MEHNINNGTPLDRYHYYKDQGYYVPYNEPYDMQEYLDSTLWYFLLDKAIRMFLGTMWIVFLVSSIGGCYKLY